MSTSRTARRILTIFNPQQQFHTTTMKYQYKDQLLGSLIVIYKPEDHPSDTSSSESSNSSTMVGINAYGETTPPSKWLHPNFCRHRSQTSNDLRVGDRVEIIKGNDIGCYGTVTLVPSNHVVKIRLAGTKGTIQRYYNAESIVKVEKSTVTTTTQIRIQRLFEELNDANPPPVRTIAFESSCGTKNVGGGGESHTTKKTVGTTLYDSSPSDEENSIRDRYRSLLPGNTATTPTAVETTSNNNMEPFIIDLVDSSEHLLSPAHSVASAPRHSIFRGVPSPRPQLRAPTVRRRRPLQVGDTVDIVKGIYKEKTGKVVKISGKSVAHVQVKGIGVAQLLSQDILSQRPDPPIGLNALFACGGVQP